MSATDHKPIIGFIGQGYVGKNYADNLEGRGFDVIRYALEEPYRQNKYRIQGCDIVFVCVPTPTTKKGFDVSIVENALSLVGKGKIAVVKSTILPGTTKSLQKKYPKNIVLHSPEFLSAKTAREDADNPFANIVGIPVQGKRHKKAAEQVVAILPQSPFTQICSSEEAELIKYAHNFSGYTQILAFNVIYELAEHVGAKWENIEQAIAADPFISNRYAKPKHKSGRGAGGPCFIKDVAALSIFYRSVVDFPEGVRMLQALERKNVALLTKTNKDLDLVRSVYGEKAVRNPIKRARKRAR